MTVFNNCSCYERQKLKEKFADSHFHNNLRLFDVLPNLLSPQVKQCMVITYEHGKCKLPHKLPNGLT